MNGAELSRPPVHRITLAQVAVLVPSSLLACRLDSVIAGSILAGGLIAVLPQAWFAARVFRFRGAQSAQAIARSSYAGEIGKFILSIAGFAAVFALVRPIDGLALFGAYLSMLVIQIVGSVLLIR